MTPPINPQSPLSHPRISPEPPLNHTPQGVDTSLADPLVDTERLGSIHWERRFNWSDESTQRHLAAACDSLRSLPFVRAGGARALSESAGVVHCFVDDFKRWLSNASGLEAHSL